MKIYTQKPFKITTIINLKNNHLPYSTPSARARALFGNRKFCRHLYVRARRAVATEPDDDDEEYGFDN